MPDDLNNDPKPTQADIVAPKKEMADKAAAPPSPSPAPVVSKEPVIEITADKEEKSTPAKEPSPISPAPPVPSNAEGSAAEGSAAEEVVVKTKEVPTSAVIEEKEPAPLPSKNPEPPKTVIVTPTVAKVESKTKFMVRFLDKLKDLRKQANKKRAEKVEENLAKILNYAKEHQRITNDEVEKLTGVKDTQAVNYLNMLVKQGKLVRFGKKRNIFYKSIRR
ncbi:DUF977 family protein [bacterium]|nr:DUF977 family protein [bacterium]